CGPGSRAPDRRPSEIRTLSGLRYIRIFTENQGSPDCKNPINTYPDCFSTIQFEMSVHKTANANAPMRDIVLIADDNSTDVILLKRILKDAKVLNEVHAVSD